MSGVASGTGRALSARAVSCTCRGVRGYGLDLRRERLANAVVGSTEGVILLDILVPTSDRCSFMRSTETASGIGVLPFGWSSGDRGSRVGSEGEPH